MICLQELSRNWYAELVPFFDSREYILVFASYHNEASGYMGVAMAWPRRFHAVGVCLKQISHVVDWTLACKSCGCELTERTLSNSCNPCYDRYCPPSYAFEGSRNRPNVAIFVRFENNSPYQAITTGSLPDGHPQKPMGRLGAILFQPMRSAYVVCSGKEPDATSFGRVPETMDFIFLSEEWAVESVRATRPVPSPYVPCSHPDATEPSDHFCVGAMLRL